MVALPQLPTPPALARQVQFIENDNRHVAEITLASGQVQSPGYAALRRHIRLPLPDQWEYTVASTICPHVVFCLSWASLQGGVIAVWNVNSRRWEHYSQSEYAVAAMLVPKLEAIITLHCVSNYVKALKHQVDVRSFKMLGVATTLSRKPKSAGFDPIKETVLQTALANANFSGFGPAGIFRYGNGETFCAHDAGNRIDFTSKDILQALKSLTTKR